MVFLLFAEERGLLPQGELFTGGLRHQRRARHPRRSAPARRAAKRSTPPTSPGTGCWPPPRRSTAGASFEDIRLPSYGGSLFDPARFAFLTARDDHGTLAVTVSDRVMLEVLRAVQMAELRGEPARRISFRDIDVEQIGYIYEGLLGYSCADVDEVTVGLIGKEGEEPEIPLATLEDLAASTATDAALADAILAWVKERPARRHRRRPRPRSPRPIKKRRPDRGRRPGAARGGAHRPGAARPAPPVHRHHPPRPAQPAHGRGPRRRAGGRDAVPRDRGRALHAQVARRGSRPVRAGTPRLRPRSAPAAETSWVPVDSDRILELKVADIACGSGAFLVAAARYLADRLVEAWQREEAVTGMTPRELETHAIRTVIATLPVRRRHQRDGRGDVQAVAVAGVPRPEAPVLLRRRQDPARQLAARA